MNVVIHHWHYNDGWRYIPLIIREGCDEMEYDGDIHGWHCWAYPDDWDLFEKWMEQNMKYEYDCTRRFNSGDPMITVFIRNDEDATLFKLTWV